MSFNDESNIPFFTMVAPSSFRWPVKVPVPGDGAYVFAAFDGEFRYLNETERDALFFPNGKPAPDLDVAKQLLIGVHGLKTADGASVPSSPELIARMLGVDRAPTAVVTTWVNVVRGLAPAKN